MKDSAQKDSAQKEVIKYIGQISTNNIQKPTKISSFKKLINVFDVNERIKSITVSKRVSLESSAFDIMRVLSLVWIMMAFNSSHLKLQNASLMDPGFKNHVLNSWRVSIIQHGYYAVDMVLFMGGYITFISMKSTVWKFKNASAYKFPLLYLFL